MTRKREVLASEAISDLPPPSHRHPMSGEPIWDQHAVRAMLRAAVARAPAAEVQIDPYSPPDDERAVIVPLCDIEASDAGRKLYFAPQATPDTSEADESPIVPGGPYSDPEQFIATLGASAPVAGEAQPVAECERCGLAPEDHTESHWCDNQSFRLGDAVQLGAAPQASEAVRVLGIDLGADGIADVRNATLEEISQVLKNGVFVSVEDAADYILTRRTKAAPRPSETDVAAFSTAVDYRRMEDTQVGASEHLAKLAAALGNRDWKWWDSCSFRRLTFADGPDRRDGGALCGWVQPSDGHPDVSMAPGVREFIEAASPKAIAALAAAYMAALPAQPEQS